MATNRIRKDGDRLSVVCSHPTTPVSGGPVRFGKFTGVALTDESEDGNATGYTSVDFGGSVWDLTVDDNEGTGIAVGDPLYYHDTGTGTGSVNVNNSSTSADAFFGFAMETVSANATTLINVRHVDLGLIASVIATVGTSQITDAAVTAAKLTTTMQKGIIQMPLASAREIASNDIINTAGDAGVLSSNTTPILARVNGATDKKLRLNWASSNSDAIQWDFAYPPDLDDAAAITIYVRAAMAGATDTPTLAINYFEGVGDTNAGGNTAAVTGTSVATYSRAIAAGDVGAAPNGASVEIVPAAHTTDALYIYEVWAEYTRK